MLGENIRNLRKQNGYSQETLAEQIHVVRQTVSKWEKGISVPDAEMLEKMAEFFEVSVSDLLGKKSINDGSSEDINEIALQLAILNDRLAQQSRSRKRIIRAVLIGITAVIIIYLFVFFMLMADLRVSPNMKKTVELHCSLNGESYLYGITYDEQSMLIIESGGDMWIADHVQVEQYDDANILIAQIEDYFTDRGGTCLVINKDT
jgi:transcriptional regulator with XRE-family HTH domain